MKIALFASAFHPHFGGVEELCRQLARQLQSSGHGVIVLTNRWPRTSPRFEVFEGIPVHRLPFRAPDAGIRSRFTYWLTRRAIEKDVAAILENAETDLLHVQCVSSNGRYALSAAKRLSLPLVVTLQGELTMDATRLFERSAFARTTLSRCMAEADLVTACSRKTLEDGEAFWGSLLGDRGRVIFNGASIEDFRVARPYRHAKRYIFAIGRLVPQKGFDVLLRAFAAARIGSHDLLLGGDGPERPALVALAGELGLTGRVTFLGRCERDAVPSFFKGASFFVLPSRADEGLPVVCAEAMAAGCAIIATRAGGAPEAVLDGQTGLIIDKEDVGALAAAMKRLCDDESFRHRLGQAGLARAARFSWPVIADEYLAAYTTAASRRQVANGRPLQAARA